MCVGRLLGRLSNFDGPRERAESIFGPANLPPFQTTGRARCLLLISGTTRANRGIAGMCTPLLVLCGTLNSRRAHRLRMRSVSAPKTITQAPRAGTGTDGQHSLAALAIVSLAHSISFAKSGLSNATPFALQRCDHLAISYYVQRPLTSSRSRTRPVLADAVRASSSPTGGRDSQERVRVYTASCG